MNRGEMRTRVWNQLREVPVEGFSDIDINNFLNEGCNDLVSRVKCLHGSDVIDSVANQQRYRIPPSIIAVDGMDFRESTTLPYKPLAEIDFRQFRISYPQGAGSGVPSQYVHMGDAVLLCPIPPAAVSGGIRFWGVLRHPNMTEDTHSPAFSEEWHDIPILYVCAKFAESDREYGEAHYYWQQYFGRVADAFLQMAQKQRGRPRRVKDMGELSHDRWGVR